MKLTHKHFNSDPFQSSYWSCGSWFRKVFVSWVLLPRANQEDKMMTYFRYAGGEHSILNKMYCLWFLGGVSHDITFVYIFISLMVGALEKQLARLSHEQGTRNPDPLWHQSSGQDPRLLSFRKQSGSSKVRGVGPSGIEEGLLLRITKTWHPVIPLCKSHHTWNFLIICLPQ